MDKDVNGSLNDPMDIAVDEYYSLSGYIWIADVNGYSNAPSLNAGFAEYAFQVTIAGEYVILSRIYDSDAPTTHLLFQSMQWRMSYVLTLFHIAGLVSGFQSEWQQPVNYYLD